MEQPAPGSTVSVVSSTPFPASTAAMEDPRMNKSRVEKLKRRIIRVVAGKLSQNPDEKEINKMWEAMKKSCKCDCKLLWKHMRAVTVKKLKRLISADDRVEDITDIARLTITDWLLYDLVLAHEDIDVIGQDIWDKTGEEPEPLIELFFLVDEYHIEKLEGTQLIEAWLNLTREYNDSGRKCSPMLLQRRWYQLKQATRKAFYLFWGNFRGNTVHFQRAVKYKPTALQVDIARKYRSLILTSFPDWNELIKKKKVILAHEFDNYITLLRQNKNKDEGPDLELIEQKIDTIDLEDDSDTEKSNDVATPTQVSANRTIKCDPENIHLTDVDDKDIHFLKEMNIPCETPFANYDDTNLVIDCGEVFSNTESRDANDSCQDQVMEVGSDSHHSLDDNDINLKMSAMVENNKENDNNELDALHRDDSNFHVNVGSKDSNAVYEESTITCDDSSDGDIAEITDIFNPSQIKIETPFFSDTDVSQIRSVKNVIERRVENDKFEEDQENIETACEESILQLNDINERKETSFHILPKIKSVTSINSDFSSTKDTYKNILAQKATELDLSLSKSSNKHFSNDLVINELTKSIEESTVKDIELLGNFDEIPKDLLFVDDGIALDDENEVAVNVEENLSSEDKMPKIDIKLLLFSTVYTKKLDHMDVFRFIEFDNIRDKRIIKCAEIESKPKDWLAYNLEDISKNEEQTVKKDIYSSDLEDNLLSVVPNSNVKEVNIIKTEYPLNEDTNNDEDTSPINYSEHHSNQNEISSDEDDESLLLIKNRVDIQNNMFKKPHVQNYNPIQLCKNPDFNTRLKRLTAGFLSYEKNREYLKRCHPVTIDLHKTFELNLIDNIMYLDESTVNTNKPSIETQGSDLKEGQHNTNNTRASIEVEESKSFDENISLDTKNHNADKSSSVITSTSTTCERNKVINLPDISEIRRVNKNLVTAEVAPLQIVINTPSEGKTINESFSNLKNEDIFTSTSTVTGSNIDKQICDNVNPIIVKETNAINKVACLRDDVYKTNEDNKNDKNANKRKIQQKKPYNYTRYYLPWNRPANFAKEEECLLASDTVDKMLALFSGQEIKSHSKNKNTQGLKRKPRLEAVKKSDEKCKKDRKVLERTKINNIDDNSNNDNNLQTGLTEDGLAVLSISQKRKKKEFCCWAQKKIMYPNLKRKHSCKRPLCTCCCRDKLLEKYKKVLAQSKPNNEPNQTAALTLSDEEVPNQTAAITLSDEEVPNQTANITLSDEEGLNQKRKFVVNVPTAPKSPPKQTINSVPSIIIDGNTNKINVPKFIVRHQTPKVIEKVEKLPNISKIPTSTPNTNIHSVESNDTNTPIHKNRLTIKRNLTNTENIHTLRKSNINVQQGCQDVLKPRSRIKFCKAISRKMQTVSARLNNAPTNTVTLNVKKGSSASPIFLGQNKILLSTVRGPMAKPIPIDTPKIILPQGVCFVLLPNNELVLSIASGVDLAPEELRHLEFVIQALQRVLGKPKTRENSVIDCAKEDMDNKEATDKNNHNIFSKNEEDTEINLSVNEDPKKTLTANEKVQNIDSAVSNIDLELSKESVNTENPSIDTNRKTILSDLMEMSGISPEDAKLPEPSILPVEPNIPCDNEMGTSEMHPDLLHLFNNPIAVAALARRPDLSILTTYSDLRYASDNNGKFFKMDVCTGEIVPINVFIKKKDQLINKKKANPIENQEPIDLTSDKDSCNESDDTLVTSIMIPAAKNNKGVDGIKPLKLFRATNSSLVKQNDTVRDTNMKVYSGPMMIGNTVLKVVNLGRRKQNLNRGIKVDMNNVTGDPKDSNQGVAATINLDESGSDSDDEPLAKKANRNREEELNYAINSEATNNDVKGCDMPMDADLDNASVVYEEIENEFESIEEAGEDCILGV
ncbi:uncharacterized protein LOC125050425 isoform X1 [Pieris napi]|uniref:uncharacterized protein LOC125050425 isoform X1 n=1 Tax=Pieris napi TaxID=78633 RepID=UPI001FBBF497|nr:uncharacterized protein LOC125050425 isoform X1 [Pieris napi]